MTNTSTMKAIWRSGQKGFTLIEAMIGIAVFSVGILAVAAMGPVSMDTNTAANDSSQVTNATIGMVERIFSIDWDAADAQTMPCNDFQPLGELEVSWCITENTSQDESETAMAMTDETGRPTVRMIRATIRDPNRKGGSRNLTLNLLKPKM